MKQSRYGEKLSTLHSLMKNDVGGSQRLEEAKEAHSKLMSMSVFAIAVLIVRPDNLFTRLI